MRILKLLAAAWVVILSLAMASIVYGNEWNQKTIIKLAEPMQIEGVLLQPGTYVFKLMDSMADRHIVRIMNENETKVVATVIGMPHYELRAFGQDSNGFLGVQDRNSSGSERLALPRRNAGLRVYSAAGNPGCAGSARACPSPAVAEAAPGSRTRSAPL